MFGVMLALLMPINRQLALVSSIVQCRDIKGANRADQDLRVRRLGGSAPGGLWENNCTTSHLRRIPRLIVTFWQPMPQPMRVHICSFCGASR